MCSQNHIALQQCRQPLSLTTLGHVQVQPVRILKAPDENGMALDVPYERRETVLSDDSDFENGDLPPRAGNRAALDTLTENSVKNIAGNAMHVGALSHVFVFLLANLVLKDVFRDEVDEDEVIEIPDTEVV